VRTLELTGFKKNVSILDVGCGTGNLLKILKDKGFTNLHGIDVSRQFVNEARKNTLLKEIICNDFLSNKFERKFKVIVCCDFLEHTPYANQAIKKIHSLCARDGIVIIQGPNLLPAIGVNSSINKKWVLTKKIIDYYFNKELRLSYTTPTTDESTHTKTDSDACYLINPMDLLYASKINNFRIFYMSTFFNPLKRYKPWKRRLVLAIEKSPIIRYFGGSLIVVLGNPKSANLQSINKLRNEY
jgi:SAM-dependent methyltransferase